MDTDKKKGRPILRVKERIKAHKLRKEGFTIREISRAILKREDPKTIWSWLHSPLPTEREV